MPRQDRRVIMLADCQSFYASVEKSAHPEYKDRPLVVAGDPARRSGIILAACPLAKSYGITTAERLGEALAKCPDVVVVRPRMAEYIRVSLHITRILQSSPIWWNPIVLMNSFSMSPEAWICSAVPRHIARSIQSRVMDETGVYIRIGISDTKVVSKMACDLYAKKVPGGICTLPRKDLPSTIWKKPVRDMFMVGSRMAQHLYKMGVHTIGDLAQTPCPD